MKLASEDPDVQEFALAAKRKGDLQDDDIDLAPHDSDYSDDEEDVDGIDLGVDINLANA